MAEQLMYTGEQCALVLSAIHALGPVSMGQLERFLFEGGLSEPFDMKVALAAIKEDGFLRQTVLFNGIVYELTPMGEEALRKGDAHGAAVAAISEDYKALFAQEANYLAQYTESATGNIPIFLSIKEGEQITLKLSIWAGDQEVAQKITKNWMKNADRTYRAIWDCIAEGEPFPTFKTLDID